ncbi:MAG: glycosyltransferase family 9 protein [bacterium]
MRINPFDFLLFVSVKCLKVFDKRKTDIIYFNPDNVKKILIISNTAIGDTLLATPAIRAVRERYPKAEIIAQINVNIIELFKNSPHLNGIIPYYGGYKRFFRTIIAFRKHCFDLVLILHGNEPQATPTAYLSGARFIIKVPNSNRYSFLLSNKSPLLTWGDFRHCIDQGLEVAKLVESPFNDKRMEAVIKAEDKDAVDSFLRKEGTSIDRHYICFQVCTSHINTRWFPERFIELGKRLLLEFLGYGIIITGSPNERKYCEEIATAISENVIFSAGKLNLSHIPALIKRVKVLVTGDTGIMHIAIAVRTPIVALYACADSKSTGPYYDKDRHRVIQKWRTCTRCLGKRCRYQKCMENISVEEVFQAIEDILRKRENE